MKILLSLLFVLGCSHGQISYIRGRKLCDMDCKNKMAPVCGSDGVIYNSVCDLKRINCGKGVFVVDSSKCRRSRGSTCNHRCSKDYDPVCGSDGRTYLNRCILLVEECRSGNTLSHYGPCISSLNVTHSCPKTCAGTQEDGPICGSDGNAYASTCDMRIRTCGQSVVQTNYIHCKTTQDCDSVCPFSYKPVCGSDGRIYSSKCQMKTKNCGKHIFPTPMVHCRPQYRSGRSCPLTCVGIEYDPVCGSNGMVYDNECDLERLNCGLGGAGRVYPVKIEKCTKKITSCTQIKCPDSPDPVCGTDSITYTNYCHLHRASCLKNVQLAHYGICPDMSTIEDCKADCQETNELAPQLPVCGSDGNMYKSECDMKKRTCGQKVVAVALHHCTATKHCTSNCKSDGVAVCGSDKKMYGSKCEMKTRNCGTHVYEVPMKNCLAGFNFVSCLRFCPRTFDPVCGTDGKTYSNDCFLKMENCRARSLGRSRVSRTYHGKCGYPQPQPKLYMFR